MNAAPVNYVIALSPAVGRVPAVPFVPVGSVAAGFGIPTHGAVCAAPGQARQIQARQMPWAPALPARPDAVLLTGRAVFLFIPTALVPSGATPEPSGGRH